MIFFWPIEVKRNDFPWKLREFLDNPSKEKFCINLRKDELEKFKEWLVKLNPIFFQKNNLEISFTSEANIDGISSSLYIFQKSTMKNSTGHLS